jgi:hypothetical protein
VADWEATRIARKKAHLHHTNVKLIQLPNQTHRPSKQPSLLRRAHTAPFVDQTKNHQKVTRDSTWRVCIIHIPHRKRVVMQPTRQKRQWHESRPGSSTDHRETQRRLRGSYWRRDNQDQDSWPPRSTSQLEQQRHANPAPTPSWRDRVKLPESRAQSSNRWTSSEAGEHSQRRLPPVQRWRSPEPPSRWRRSELDSDSSSVSRSWPQRNQDSRAPRSLNVSRLDGGHAPERLFVHNRWDSAVATKDARSSKRQWVPNPSHDAGDDADDDCHDDDGDYDDDDDDGGDEEEEGEDKEEQSKSTLMHRYSPPASSYERWQDVRADHRRQRSEGPIRLSPNGHVGVLGNQVPSWPTHRKPSSRVEMPARRWSESDKSSEDSQSEAYQQRATQSRTTDLVDAQSFPVRPKRREMVEAGKSVTPIVRRPPCTFEAGQAPSLEDKYNERVGDGDDVGSDSNAHSTSKRRPSTPGKRKATLKRDVAIVGCGSCEPGEELVPIKPKVSGSENRVAKPRSHGARKRRGKRCQYPQGCGKGALGATLLCIAHGGGKRCQYFEGCDKSARGSTMFCKAHGGGKRCQYPEGCDKSAEGSTVLCKAHGGGKRCQYPNGCDKSALGSTMFCVAHGGGKRCQYPDGCEKGAAGSTVFCLSHGGGKRCQYPNGCDKSALGSTMLCAAHGGGKRCQYPDGCDKTARGSTMFCTAHGGGKRCQYPEGCYKGAQGSTTFCLKHGGGKRCQYPDGCGKSSPGSTTFCLKHGGGKRCQYPDGCGKSSRGSTMFCAAHGGGKRCQYPGGCDKSAIGATLCCTAHGGGKRCQYPNGCDKCAQGSTMFCKTHGGGKRCQYPDGCDKSACGSTMFCKTHGGGKRCQYPDGCDKSARGSTMFCKAHGGGKRCQYSKGCDKSAQGSTTFCIAHGGGKRCQYPEGCDKSARGSTMFCSAHGGGRRCGHESGCRKHATRGGLCKSHGTGAELELTLKNSNEKQSED